MDKEEDSRITQMENEILSLKKQLEQNREEISKTESIFRSIFDHSADGIALMDSNGIVREWNTGYEQISGLPRKLVVGKMYIWEVAELLFPFEERTGEECKEMIDDLKGMVVAMQKKTYIRHVKHSKTGEHRIFNVLYFPVAKPSGEMMYCGISRDITEEIKARELLEENERKLTAEKERLETLSDNLPEGTLYRYIFDRGTGKRYMEYVSGTWEQVTGLTPESVTEDITTFDRIVHPDDWPRMENSNESANTNLSNYNVEIRISKKGELRWLRIASHPYTDGNKVIWDGIMTDITDRKEVEMELIRAKEKAEESDKLKSAFLANVSHEIRTPLNGITGFLHFISSDKLSPTRKQEYINVINNSSSQLAKLIDDIIDVAKIEAKQMNINPVPLCINRLMKEMQLFFETYLKTNDKEHIVLIVDDSQALTSCVTYIDPVRLRQILNNLISNAIKFTEKGFISIAYRQSAPDQLEFVVENTGIGLAPEHLEVIFERFRQVDLTNSRMYGGTGLGLNIARSLVQMMGGEMWVESTEGVGSSFYFTITYLPVTPKL